MLNKRLAWLERPDAGDLIRQGLRGIERETLRVRRDGQLSGRKHPKAFGSALTHPYLTTDYSEAMLEFVTPPQRTNWETLQFLCDMHAFVHRGLEGELLWPASMPCVVNANEEIPIADYGPSNAGMMRTVYRRGLGHRYGRAMQAIAGAHFNYSLPESFWPAYRDFVGSREPLQQFKSAQLMGLVRNYRRYAWLVVYLLGASPAFCKSFRPEGHELLEELDRTTWYAPFATSLRMSDMGYRNKTQARLSISANSLDEYVAGLAAAISTEDPRYASIGVRVDGEYRQLNANILQIENEYYSSIRPKPRPQAIRPSLALQRNGIEYVEIRTVDLNIADPVGLNQNQLRLLEALALYCLLIASPPIDADEQAEIDARDLVVARRGRAPGLELQRRGRSAALIDWGHELLDGIGEVAAVLDGGAGAGEGYVAAVAGYREALADPQLTPSARLLTALDNAGAGFFEYVLDLARRHHDYFLALPTDPDRATELDAVATESLAAAEALERAPAPSFDAYLRRYFE
jgi:glutamate--cysteine ligase